jgi:DtxR family manganese transport transcriptional regulator
MKNNNRSVSLPFSRTREAHQSELAEDYVETILDLIEETGQARLLEISQRLGVTHPTVSKSLKKLKRDGLVEILPYRSILLTKDGEKLAQACKKRHGIVFNFLLALGLDSQTAQNDAEGIEHHVSPKTLKVMENFSKV